MSRGKKLVALVTETCNFQDESEHDVPKFNYDANKVIHVLEDVNLQYLQSSEFNTQSPSDFNANKTYYEMNDDVSIIPLSDLSSTLMTENSIDYRTICSDISFTSTTFNDMPYNSHDIPSITNDNLIIIPSSLEIQSATNMLLSDNRNSFHIQSSEILSPEKSNNLFQTMNNFPTLDRINTVDVHPNLAEFIPFNETTHQVVPNPPILDDSDSDKKLVPYSDSESDSISDITKSKKRNKRSEVDKKEWFSKKNKRRREKGKKFFGREKKEEGWNYNKPKEVRAIKSRCSCKIGKYSTLRCEKVDENLRKSIFDQFWSLTWGEKKTLVNEWVTQITTARPRNRETEETTKRANTFVYHLKDNDKIIKVCRKMFLNTLDIGRWTVQNWKHEFSTRPPSVLRNLKQSSESISEPKQSLIKFLESLPVMESHYCRATSRKLYLLPEWNSKESLYQFYVNDWCKQRNIKALSISLFSNLFEGKNFALFKPKKDQCEKCACYKVGTVSEELYSEHIEKRKQAREEKEKDKNADNYVLTVDLQAVLLAPKSNVSTLYYKTKLQVHNLCFFNIKNKDGFCFIWNEVEGGLNAEEFASIWVDFLENTMIPEINFENETETKTIIIYSDGCTYQNRNCILSNALINTVMRHKNIVIEQKFLEVGHTQMEADSMHSTIERHLKNKIIHVPAEYISIAKNARKCPAPYIVKYLDHTYFKNFNKIQFYKSIRPGRSKGDPKVTDIRALRYETTGSILYKTCFKDQWLPIPQRRSLQCNPCEITNLTQLHQDRRKITARKFEDLQQIKKTLPTDYHKYYEDLPHETNTE